MTKEATPKYSPSSIEKFGTNGVGSCTTGESELIKQLCGGERVEGLP